MWRAHAHEYQLPPSGDWTTWLILGGRGAGKTRAGAEFIRALVAGDGANANDNEAFQTANTPQSCSRTSSRAIALVAETYADAREVMIDGPSGICAVASETSRPAFEASRRRLVWPNGAVAYCFSAEDPDGIRGYQFDAAWSDAAIDFMGIDNYMPMADWRDGFSHTDAVAGAASQYDLDYLKSNINGGEGYDWFYASLEDRDNQIRTPITDTTYGEPWVFRYKDLWNWWSSAHHNRPGGVRSASATSWVPQSKKIVFTETGCPAVDKGANQPNVFVDPKSTESATPYFSTGARDDMAQRRFLEAQSAFWNDAANNPTSTVYSGAMVDAARFYVYAYDARPFPDFPARSDVWGDSANWEKGHWLNGRLGRAPLDLLVTALGAEAGFTAIDAGALKGVLTGYIVDRPLSPREMIDPLADVFQFDMIESGDTIRFQPRDGAPILTIEPSALADRDNGAFSLALSQESDLPAAFRLGFLDETEDFAVATVEARDPGARPHRETGAEIAAVIPAAEAEARARSILADAWVMRETLEFSLPASALDVEPGDAILLDDKNAEGSETERRYRITEIDDGAERRVSLVRVSPSVYAAPVGPLVLSPPQTLPVYAPPLWALMDLPLLSETQTPGAPHFAAFSDPWPGGAALYRSNGESAPVLSCLAPARAVIGRLKTALPAAASGRWDRRPVEVTLAFGNLSSRAAEEIFSGANVFAVESAGGEWEVAQFEKAQLLGDGHWRLTGLLRGQAGTEAQSLSGAPVDARFVLLTAAVTQAEFPTSLRGLTFDWQAGPETDIPDTENFTSRSLTMRARGLQPLSPVHLRARRESDDIRLSWIRRTRLGGDSWEGEVPLSEAYERYTVTIFDGATPVRSVETTTPDYMYSAADITSDFGAPGVGSSITFSVAQISDAVGTGVEKKGNAALL